MIKFTLLVISFILSFPFPEVQAQKKKEIRFVKENFEFAGKQLNALLKAADLNPRGFPRSVDSSGHLTTTDMYGWTSGFFPGELWYTGDFLNDSSLKNAAARWTSSLSPVQFYKEHHDLGFMMYCSYGNAFRIKGNEEYKKALVNAAKSLSTRFSPVTGAIKSWNKFSSLHDRKKIYNFPVIIDNMMNLELLFFATEVTGDVSFREIAVKHAMTTLKNQVREDFSSFHVVCYDSLTGKIFVRETSQGYADNSTWARGEAWGLYGFTMCYRQTSDPVFLKTAMGMADLVIHHPNLPADKIPYWDFNAGDPGFTPGEFSKATKLNQMQRDVSAAAILASALLELSRFAGEKGKEYKETAVRILHSLASPAYRSRSGTNNGFLLIHSVGNIPGGTEIDVPIIYADYYFLEALKRYHDWYLKN